MARLIWAPEALRDLEDLLAYISKDAPLTARRFGQKIMNRVEQAAVHPLLGNLVPEDDSRVYRELYQGNYRIIYRFDGETVFLVAVRHAARLLDPESLG